ncbi:MAG TPA: hypothetical protein VNR89_07275 [Roseomonas sp.]|nr:hypothetical protein [Roseomonas sp.]
MNFVYLSIFLTVVDVGDILFGEKHDMDGNLMAKAHAAFGLLAAHSHDGCAAMAFRLPYSANVCANLE